jgi:cytochrome bd-type quinol oxidase subunit 1
MTSEITVVAEKIQEIVPQRDRSLELLEWIEGNLAKGYAPIEVIDKLQKAFNISQAKVAKCESAIANLGVKVDAHIAYAEQRFTSVNSQIAQVKTELAIAQERLKNQEVINNLMANQSRNHVIYSYFPFDFAYMIILLFIFGFIFAIALPSYYYYQQPRMEQRR